MKVPLLLVVLLTSKLATCGVYKVDFLTDAHKTAPTEESLLLAGRAQEYHQAALSAQELYEKYCPGANVRGVINDKSRDYAVEADDKMGAYVLAAEAVADTAKKRCLGLDGNTNAADKSSMIKSVNDADDADIFAVTAEYFAILGTSQNVQLLDVEPKSFGDVSKMLRLETSTASTAIATNVAEIYFGGVLQGAVETLKRLSDETLSTTYDIKCNAQMRYLLSIAAYKRAQIAYIRTNSVYRNEKYSFLNLSTVKSSTTGSLPSQLNSNTKNGVAREIEECLLLAGKVEEYYEAAVSAQELYEDYCPQTNVHGVITKDFEECAAKFDVQMAVHVKAAHEAIEATYLKCSALPNSTNVALKSSATEGMRNKVRLDLSPIVVEKFAIAGTSKNVQLLNVKPQSFGDVSKIIKRKTSIPSKRITTTAEDIYFAGTLQGAVEALERLSDTKLGNAPMRYLLSINAYERAKAAYAQTNSMYRNDDYEFIELPNVNNWELTAEKFDGSPDTPTGRSNKGPFASPSINAATSPTVSGTKSPTVSGTKSPTVSGTKSATVSGTKSPTVSGTKSPTVSGTKSPTVSGTKSATVSGTKSATVSGTKSPTVSGTKSPTVSGTKSPTVSGTKSPTVSGTKGAVRRPSSPTTAGFRSFGNLKSPAGRVIKSPTASAAKSPTVSSTKGAARRASSPTTAGFRSFGNFTSAADRVIKSPTASAAKSPTVSSTKGAVRRASSPTTAGFRSFRNFTSAADRNPNAATRSPKNSTTVMSCKYPITDCSTKRPAAGAANGPAVGVTKSPADDGSTSTKALRNTSSTKAAVRNTSTVRDAKAIPSYKQRLLAIRNTAVEVNFTHRAKPARRTAQWYP